MALAVAVVMESLYWSSAAKKNIAKMPIMSRHFVYMFKYLYEDS